MLGGTTLMLMVSAFGVTAAQAADPTVRPAVTPEPAAAQFPAPVAGELGTSSGLYAVGGGLVVVAGGAAMWLRRRKSGRVTVH
ncbi:hypothetical protein ASE03_02825 [Kitasatospora sp. Root187]|nr:hypothetical protein ASC99_01915 [Kitasatospora sp. Root107]KRB67300.1 hypothetical protein ASE03_02825 [Kitasatospora sp. Root187]